MQPGMTLGHYRLVEKIGEGGMGVVWHAVDTTLGRDVAIKVLPDLFARDPERLARFEREARTLASLNHPGIAAIYAFEQAEGLRFLAMELVRGEDLAQRLARGPLPADEAVAASRAIAEALESAHDHGIVHRDLKPANVVITETGSVKLLDFGLARALEFGAGPAAVDPAMSPTITSAGTIAGMILGTAAYMSPEQARGKTVDRRADIWAFGCVLYEMLSGRRAFHGETVSETIAEVLKSDPDWKVLPPTTPEPLRGLMRRCLEKDPRRRLQAIGEARIVLEDPASLRHEPREAGTPGGAVAAAPSRAAFPGWIPWGIAAALALIVVAVLVRGRFAGGSPPRGPLRLALRLCEGTQQLEALGGATVVPAPDGRTIAFAVTGDERANLFVRRLDALSSTPIPSTGRVQDIFFSPDGKWIGFATATSLMRVPPTGGAPEKICDLGEDYGRGATWGDLGEVVFASGFGSGLSRVSASGGKPVPLTTLDASHDERSHRWPWFLPGGKAALFMTQHTGQSYDDADIEAVTVPEGRRKLLVRGGAYPRYASDGRLLYVRRGVLYAAPFDASRVELTGQAKPIVDGVLAKTVDQETGDGSAQFAVSRTGLLLYRAAAADEPPRERAEFVWVEAGRDTPIFKPETLVTSFELSPDGTRVAYDGRQDQASEIYIHDLARGVDTRLTSGPGRKVHPIWSPDGTRIAYGVRGTADIEGLYVAAADGSGAPERVVASRDEGPTPMSWSKDGSRVLFALHRPQTQEDLAVVTMRGEHRVSDFLTTPAAESQAEFSPDGRWVAYMQMTSTGAPEIFVTPFPGPGGRWQVSSGGNADLRWAPDGRTLYFVGGDDDRLFAAGFEAPAGGAAPRLGASRQAMPGRFSGPLANPGYAPHPDGKRFLVLRRPAERAVSDTTHVILVME